MATYFERSEKEVQIDHLRTNTYTIRCKKNYENRLRPAGVGQREFVINALFGLVGDIQRLDSYHEQRDRQQNRGKLFFARRYASVVLAVVECPSVCPSVCHKLVTRSVGVTSIIDRRQLFQ